MTTNTEQVIAVNEEHIKALKILIDECVIVPDSFDPEDEMMKMLISCKEYFGPNAKFETVFSGVTPVGLMLVDGYYLRYIFNHQPGDRNIIFIKDERYTNLESFSPTIISDEDGIQYKFFRKANFAWMLFDFSRVTDDELLAKLEYIHMVKEFSLNSSTTAFNVRCNQHGIGIHHDDLMFNCKKGILRNITKRCRFKQVW